MPRRTGFKFAIRLIGLAALLTLSVVGLVPSAEAANTNYAENFEDDTSGLNPSNPAYAYAAVGTNALVTTAQFHGGAKSFQTSPTSSTDRSTFDYNTANLNICNTGSTFTWWMRLNALPSAGNLVGYYLQPTPGSTGDFGAINYIGIQVSQTGGIAFQIGTGGSFVPTPTIAANTWADFTIYGVDCTSDKGCLSSATLVINGCGDGPGDTVTGTISAFSVLSNAAYIGTTTWLDDLTFSSPPVVPTVTAVKTATPAPSNLVGFGVDDTGATAIARTDSGQYVRVYPGGTLDTPSSQDTDCNLVGGVAAAPSHVAYLACTSSADVEYLKIRSPSLGSPSFATDECTNGDFCQTNIPTEGDEGLAGDQDDDTHLALFEEFPIDYSAVRHSGFNRVLMAFAFADTTGKLGVTTYTHVNNAGDSSAITYVGIANQSPDQICTHRDPNGFSYLYGASQTSNVRGFYVAFEETGAGDDYELVPTMSQVFPGSGSTAGPLGVACGDYRLAILNTDKVTLYNRTANGQSNVAHCSITGLTGTVLGGIAMSHNGEWIAYISGGYGYIANARTCANVVRGAVPAGAAKAIDLDGVASNMWIATSGTPGNIQRFSVYAYTTGADTLYNAPLDPEDVDGDHVPNDQDPDIDGDGQPNTTDLDDDGDGILDVVDNSPSGATGEGEESSDSLFAPFVASFALILGSEIAGRLATTVILMLSIGAVLGGRWGLGGLILGCCIGFGMAVVGLVFPKDWALVIVLLLLGGTVVAFFAGGRK